MQSRHIYISLQSRYRYIDIDIYYKVGLHWPLVELGVGEYKRAIRMLESQMIFAEVEDLELTTEPRWSSYQETEESAL